MENDGRMVVKYSKKGMRKFLNSFFNDRFHPRAVRRNRVIFYSKKDAEYALDYIISETNILHWGFSFVLRKNKLYFELTPQVKTFVDELRRDPDYVKNAFKRYL